MGRTVATVAFSLVVALASALPTPAVEDDVFDVGANGMDGDLGARQDAERPASSGAQASSSIEMEPRIDAGEGMGDVAVSPDGSHVANAYNDEGEDRAALICLPAPQ